MKSIPVRHINAVKKEPDISGSFSIRDVREMLDAKDMVQGIHRHDFYFILALKKGAGYHGIDFTEYEVCDHAVFLMRPGQVHRLTLKAGSAGYLLQFEPDFFYTQNKLSQQLLRKAGNKNFCKPDSGRFKKLFSILTYIFNEYTGKEEGYHEVIKSSLHIFFTEIARNSQNKNTPSDDSNTYTQEQLEIFLELLETHIAGDKQVSKYADMMNLSSYQLNAITKTTLNKNPSELINEHIIMEAKRNLLATSGQVNQIADELGYEDVSYFIRFFKKHTGYSPEAFRDNFR
jgi:AraC family transcriptional regulator, transcriptional activator of pobA